MSKSRYQLLCGLIVLFSLLATCVVYGKLPPTIPTHWNADGVADGSGPRGFIFVHPGLMIACIALWSVLPALSPRRFTVAPFLPTYWFIGLLAVAMIAYMQAVILAGTLNASIDLGRAVLGGVLVFIALLGNVLGKVRRNFWIGIRTPWTLADDRVWYATHRLAARTMVVAALAGLGALLLGLAPHVAIAALIAGALLPLAYSLVYSKRLERKVHVEH
jgi:uncharacterized membrane protein